MVSRARRCDAWLLIAVVLSIAMIMSCGGREKAEEPKPLAPVATPVAGSVEEALELAHQGRTSEATTMLKSLASATPGGPRTQRAALLLGNLLLGAGKGADAVPFLVQAADGEVVPDYAALLYARAVAEAGLTSQYDDALRRLAPLARGTVPGQSTLVAEEASLLELRLLLDKGAAKEAATRGTEFLRRWTAGSRADEARWLTGKALHDSGDRAAAYRVFSDIWWDSPTNPHAKEAQARMKTLEGEGIAPRRVGGEALYQHAKSLQAAGLHPEALDELRGLTGGGARADEALYLTTISTHVLRKNEDCVGAARRLRDRYSGSPWVPAASVMAIKALRRGDNVPEVRSWVDFLRSSYPSHAKTGEAIYNLGVLLQNTGNEAEGVALLEEMVANLPDAENADDALWKIAWSQRRAGDTAGAVATLARLLTTYPKSGFRKAAWYWIGRFTADTDRARSIDSYATLLREFPHDYYGHEARKNLASMGETSLPIGNGESLPAIDRLERPDARSDEGYALVVALKQAGLYEYAAEELKRIPALQTDPGLQFALASLYSRAERTWEANAIMKKYFSRFMTSGSRDPSLVPAEFWQVCYPFNYRPLVEQSIREAGLGPALEPSLLASLVRLESLFYPRAISSVGAVGLMQLMPDTARQVAERRGLPVPTRAELFDPMLNLRYGTAYLSEMVEKFNGDWFPAICSYNAGPESVSRWWSTKPAELPLDEFIEQIPFVDTRIYIKQVLGDRQNYEWIYAMGG